MMDEIWRVGQSISTSKRCDLEMLLWTVVLRLSQTGSHVWAFDWMFDFFCFALLNDVWLSYSKTAYLLLCLTFMFIGHSLPIKCNNSSAPHTFLLAHSLNVPKIRWS